MGQTRTNENRANRGWGDEHLWWHGPLDARQPSRHPDSRVMEPLAAIGPATIVSAPVDLVARAARGDLRAFEQLVITGSDRSFRIARAILGNDADARDAVQEAYVSAWRDLPRLRDHQSFDAWLRRIVVNACRTVLRSRRRIREISLDVREIDPTDTDSDLPHSIGETDALTRAFDRLDDAKRSILVLHYLEHESIASIAAAMGIATGTVKWRLSEARAALGRALTAEEAAR
jgi:RNA polymerase sigma-70 factor (ECF subfamily)